MKRIYLDYAATSPVKPEVVKAMIPYFSEKFGNASSIHSFGREAREAIDKARSQVSKFLNCGQEEVIFTSGGTESDNLAIRGLISNYELPASRQGGRIMNYEKKQKPHIITSSFEHHAVLDTCKDLEKRGLAEVTYINPDKEGIISVESVKAAIKSNSVLVSIMYVNNEIGTVQPISEISKLISQNNELRIKNNAKNHNLPFIIHNSKIHFHTDAVQAIEYQNCDVKKLGVDMLSLSAHKFGGSKGVGALYIKKGTPIHHQNIGGAQEYRLRAGTENTPGIVGMGKAIDELRIMNYELRIKQMQKLRDYFIDQAMKEIPDVSLNGSRKFRNPNNVNLAFKYVEGESILIHLDLAGIAASSGSACTSGSLEPSHVIKAIGLTDIDAHGTIRFTLGETTNKEEIDYVLKVLPGIIKKLREMSPFGRK